MCISFMLPALASEMAVAAAWASALGTVCLPGTGVATKAALEMVNSPGAAPGTTTTAAAAAPTRISEGGALGPPLPSVYTVPPASAATAA